MLLTTAGRNLQKTSDQGPNRVLPLADAEVQNKASMDGKALAPCGFRETAGKPSLADTCFATQQDRLSPARL